MLINDTSQNKKEYLNPWGKTPKERNVKELTLRAIFDAVDIEDGSVLDEIFNELTHEQNLDIWYCLASHTRAMIKDLRSNL